MHLGMIMECDYRPGGSQEDAFKQAFSLVDLAEDAGMSGVWLAERHFAPPKGHLDSSGTTNPSIASVPLVLASAIAARTERLRIGIAVAVLPLCHPVRMAEEAATVDHISQGRLDFGVGRSSFTRAYEGYGIPYGESRERFQESLDVITKAWTQERFSHEGKFFTIDDLSVLPKPYQKPHPPIRMAANSPETFASVGSQGLPLFVGLRSYSLPEVAKHMGGAAGSGVSGGTRRIAPDTGVRCRDRGAGHIGTTRQHHEGLPAHGRLVYQDRDRHRGRCLCGAGTARSRAIQRNLPRLAAGPIGVRHAGDGSGTVA